MKLCSPDVQAGTLAPGRGPECRLTLSVATITAQVCRWWRLLLDEAQKAGTGRVAAMTEQMAAQHRWLVTGTPIGRQGRWGLEDIHALLRVLCLDPLLPIKSPAFSHEALQASGQPQAPRVPPLNPEP